MDKTDYKKEYMERLLDFLDKLLYTAFLLKKEKDFENLPMRGLVITEGEVDQAFAQMHASLKIPEDAMELLVQNEREIRDIEKKAGDSLPFFVLCQTFLLTGLERLALILSAAPFFNRKYEKIYGYLQDRVDVLEPTRGLCVSLAELLTDDIEEEIAVFLSDRGNLHFMLEVSGGEQKGLASVCRLKPRVIDFLYGSLELSERLKSRSVIFNPLEKLAPMEIREDYLERLCRLWDHLLTEKHDNGMEISYMILLYGRSGIGKQFLLKHLAAKKNLRLLFFDISELMYEKEDVLEKVLEELFVESMLQQAQIVLTGAELVQESEEESHEKRQDRRKEIFSWIEKHFSLFFLLAEEKEEQTGDFPGQTVSMELPSLTAGEKVHLWEAWGREYPLQQDVDLEQNGNKYNLTPKGIRDVLDTADLVAGMEGQDHISQEHIRQAVKQNQQNQLGSYATLINSCFLWEDLILGEEQKAQMRMVCDQMRYRAVVGEQWGFHKKTPYGRGLSVLFYGPPGTGKTMAAQVMASELCLDLYRIELPAVVSKYIGETEKNLEEIFEQAKKSQVILLFDEADVLFSKRTEVRDSNDKYSNMEAAFLLQKMEEYEGITVLATNFLQNFDEAFKRRMKFIIDFPFPDIAQRLQIWKQVFPKETPIEEELDYEFLAQSFELSGSNIKNVALHAAFLAAAENCRVGMRQIVAGVRNEFIKSGKTLTKEQLGQYYMLL